MNIKIIWFIIVLISTSVLTTFVYQNTQQADINYYQGYRLFEKGEYNKAVEFYEQTLAIEPLRLDALKEIAYSYQWTDRFEKAIGVFRKALSLDPQNYKIKKSLAKTYSWEKEYKKAISLYKEVITMEEDDIDAQRELAKVYIWDGQYDKAKKISRA